MSWKYFRITRISAQAAGLPILAEGALLLGRDTGGTARRLFVFGGKDGGSWCAADTPPVGFVYFQGPSDSPPGDLWPGATWAVVTDEAGVFRRCEGGSLASGFGSGMQGDAIRNIWGNAGGLSPTAEESRGAGTSGAFKKLPSPATSGDWNPNNSNGFPLYLDVSSIVPTAAENRPYNVSVRKWRRTE